VSKLSKVYLITGICTSLILGAVAFYVWDNKTLVIILFFASCFSLYFGLLPLVSSRRCLTRKATHINQPTTKHIEKSASFDRATNGEITQNKKEGVIQ